MIPLIGKWITAAGAVNAAGLKVVGTAAAAAPFGMYMVLGGLTIMYGCLVISCVIGTFRMATSKKVEISGGLLGVKIVFCDV